MLVLSIMALNHGLTWYAGKLWLWSMWRQVWHVRRCRLTTDTHFKEGKIHTDFGLYSCIMLLPGITVVLKLTSDDSCVHSSACSTAQVYKSLTLQYVYHPVIDFLSSWMEPAANRYTPNYCAGLACRTHLPTETRQTSHRERQTPPPPHPEKNPVITRATNPLIRTWSSLVFKRQDECQAKVRKQMQGAYREKGWILVLKPQDKIKFSQRTNWRVGGNTGNEGYVHK